jgi:hypothetical protein
MPEAPRLTVGSEYIDDFRRSTVDNQPIIGSFDRKL